MNSLMRKKKKQQQNRYISLSGTTVILLSTSKLKGDKKNKNRKGFPEVTTMA